MVPGLGCVAFFGHNGQNGKHTGQILADSDLAARAASGLIAGCCCGSVVVVVLWLWSLWIGGQGWIGSEGVVGGVTSRLLYRLFYLSHLEYSIPEQNSSGSVFSVEYTMERVGE
eukprot:scaffold7852_cov66-Cyclotella_meneghiniana.AAC.5